MCQTSARAQPGSRDAEEELKCYRIQRGSPRLGSFPLRALSPAHPGWGVPQKEPWLCGSPCKSPFSLRWAVFELLKAQNRMSKVASVSVWTNRLGRLELELTRPSQAALWHFPNIPDPNQQEFLLYLHAWIKNHPDSLLGSQGGRDTRGCVGQRRNLCLELRAGSSWGFLHLHIIKTNSKARF